MLNINNDKEKIVYYLQVKDEEQKQLFEEARIIRNRLCGNNVYIRGILEVSNYCCCNCKFCGNAANAKRVQRYRMSFQEIKEQIDLAKNLGLDVVHIASGEDPGFDFDILCSAIKYIIQNGMYPELAVGKLSEKQYEKIFELGARRLILKFETSDEKLFREIKPCKFELNELIALIEYLVKRGFHVGSGNIIGLPGQSIESVADDLLLVSKLGVKMASTSVFTPNLESEFANEKKGDANIALNYIALLRCMFSDKKISIPANSTFGVEGKRNALTYASNELSLNITHNKYRNNYSLYEGKDRVKGDIGSIKNTIADSGCVVSTLSEVIYE